MNKNTKKNFVLAAIILFSFLIFFSSANISFVSAATPQPKPLEVVYPEIPGATKPETTTTMLPTYIQYILNFLIVFVGLVGFAVLVRAGIIYLTSLGKPDRLNEAKGQILSAFWGIVLLLSSYLILTTINPRILSLKEIEVPPLPSSVPPIPVSSFLTREDLLTRISELAETIKKVPPLAQRDALEIKTLTNNCNCNKTQSLCLCTGGGAGDSCQPRFCYAGDNAAHSHPCPDADRIDILQKNIVDERDVLLYYRTRVLAEKNELTIDIENFLNKEISWYNELIQNSKSALAQLQGSAKTAKEKLIQAFEEEKSWLEEEKGYKTDLIPKLDALAQALLKIEPPSTELAQLVTRCYSDVKTKCQATCQGKCHDYLQGCQPDVCSGGNPCPVGEINSRAQTINGLPAEITSLADEIISAVSSIEEKRERATAP